MDDDVNHEVKRLIIFIVIAFAKYICGLWQIELQLMDVNER